VTRTDERFRPASIECGQEPVEPHFPQESEEGKTPGVESYFINHTGWLRAALLGANDGIISTASLIVGVASAHPGRNEILTAAIAGVAAGCARVDEADSIRSISIG